MTFYACIYLLLLRIELRSTCDTLFLTFNSNCTHNRMINPPGLRLTYCEYLLQNKLYKFLLGDAALIYGTSRRPPVKYTVGHFILWGGRRLARRDRIQRPHSYTSLWSIVCQSIEVQCLHQNLSEEIGNHMQTIASLQMPPSSHALSANLPLPHCWKPIRIFLEHLTNISTYFWRVNGCKLHLSIYRSNFPSSLTATYAWSCPQQRICTKVSDGGHHIHTCSLVYKRCIFYR